MRRVIGMDIHRTFAEVVFWEDGRLRWHGRVDMTRAGLEGFGRSLMKDDEVVLEATGNAMAVVRVLSPHVARVIMANPLQVKAIAHAHVKTDKIDAGVLASLHAAGSLPAFLEVRVVDELGEPVGAGAAILIDGVVVGMTNQDSIITLETNPGVHTIGAEFSVVAGIAEVEAIAGERIEVTVGLKDGESLPFLRDYDLAGCGKRIARRD